MFQGRSAIELCIRCLCIYITGACRPPERFSVLLGKLIFKAYPSILSTTVNCETNTPTVITEWSGLQSSHTFQTVHHMVTLLRKKKRLFLLDDNRRFVDCSSTC